MPTKYIPFYKEAVEGQALLDNFVRTRRELKYEGNNQVYTDIQRGMPYYEVVEKEKVGQNDKNLVLRGECISACAYLKDKGIKVDLVYIDPPFASGADYAKKVYIRRNPKLAEKVKKAEEEMQDDELKSFEEKMYGDVWNKEAYLNWMYENLCAIKSVMSDTASIYVHLDYHIDSYVKILMDEIFGEDKFQNEIIWSYSWGSRIDSQWNKKHDTIYFYNKKKKFVFNSKDVLEKRQISEATANRLKYKGAMTKDGNKGRGNEELALPTDVWYIATINGMANEKQDYSTQKPEELLEKIIKASSNKGMIVADFFGGGGVTAKVANDLGRNFIHVDVGLNSIQTTRDRLIENKAEFCILEVNDGVNLYRNPVQTMDKIKELIPGLKNEDSLDKFWEGSITDTKNGTMPVYIPNLMDSTTRILDLGLINRIIREAMPDLDSNEINKVIVYYIDISNKNEIEEYIKQNNDTNIEIELRDLKPILANTTIDDEIEYSLNKIDSNYEITIDSFISDRLNQKINKYNDNMKANKKDHKVIQISDEGLELIEYISLDCTNKNGIWNSDSEIKIDKLGYVSINGNKTKEFWNGKIKCYKRPLRMKIRNIAGDETIIDINKE